MSLFTILALIFILFAWSRALNRFRGRLMSLREFCFWTLVWAAAVGVVILPGYSNDLASRIGVGRGADVVVYVSIMAIFYLLYRLYTYIGTIEREITRLVRALAVESKHKDK